MVRKNDGIVCEYEPKNDVQSGKTQYANVMLICKRLKCEQCDSNFGNTYQLKTHVKRVHVQEFKCKKCGSSFENICDMKKHLENVHD